MTTTTTFDFAPLYRHAVGFDRFANMAQKIVKQQIVEQQLTALRSAKTCKAKQTAPQVAKVNCADVNSKVKNAQKQAVSQHSEAGYPRYNISQVGELDYQITLALAGFSLEEIDITVTADELVITGKKQVVETTSTLLHQGINQADFSRKFALADHVQVLSADMNQGLLTVSLHREVPEALKPRKVTIGG